MTVLWIPASIVSLLARLVAIVLGAAALVVYTAGRFLASLLGGSRS